MLSSVFFDLAIDGVFEYEQFRGKFSKNIQTTLNLNLIDSLIFLQRQDSTCSRTFFISNFRIC